MGVDAGRMHVESREPMDQARWDRLLRKRHSVGHQRAVQCLLVVHDQRKRSHGRLG